MDIPTPIIITVLTIQCERCNSTFFGPRARRWYKAHARKALTACQPGGTGEC
jgi:hypothetical protein